MTNEYLDLLAHFGIGGAHPGGFSLTQSIFKDEKINPSDSVLDIGCGTGQTAEYVVNKFHCLVTAIDSHPLMVKKTNERFKHDDSMVKVILGDAQNLNLANDSFEFVLAESVIAFTEISKTLKELSRVLKKDGSMLIIEMTAERELPEELQKKVCSLYGIKEILNEEDWISKLKEVGFTQIDILKTPSQLIQTELNDVNQSENIPMRFFDLWDEHQTFIEEQRNIIGFRAFRCRF